LPGSDGKTRFDYRVPARVNMGSSRGRVTLAENARRSRKTIRRGPIVVTEPSRAVFLSYASQDAEAAQRICHALRAAGIEVWFDQSELRGGDAWDQSIRKQIKTCVLFIPVISHATHDRREGYFRLEWKLAVDRSHLMDPEMAFLLPVVIDDTHDDDERVPERFREVQWSRLPGGDATPTFVERVRRLLSPEAATAPGLARPASSTVASSAPAPRGLIRRRTRVLYGAIAAAVLLALGYFALERLSEPKLAAPLAVSIAVLPLTNESGDASQQYFSDGISEDLITALSQFPGLKVIGRTSAFHFRDSKEDSRTIGAKLGVARLLEGSVRRSGEMVRVTAELIDTADGSTQWSERYDRPYKDLFALQDDITHAVVVALRARLLPGEYAAAQSDRPPGGSLEAYNAMLQGRFYYLRSSGADDRKAIEYLTLATKLDPRYALAWSWLARAWTYLGSNILEGPAAQEAYAKAREAGDRSLALAPELAAAHLSRGYLLQVADYDWRGAEVEFRRALTLAPNDGDAKFNLSIALASFGELQPAIEFTQQALTTDPLRPSWYGVLALYLSALNRLDEAERAIRRAIELQPAALFVHYILTYIQVQRGNAQAALEAAQQEVPGPFQDAALALARQIGGDRTAADAALRTLIDRDANSSAYLIAEIYALRNDAKATFEWLDRAWSNRDPGILNLYFDAFILRFRDDPRFAAFCRKVGLPVPGETSSRKST
jgi:TolB-like protein/Tfp pilus assembly protein PilF